ncbi:MAG: hypothetical protein HY650_16390 [Acidobacteria bacterium]|nr:hypothetical protein [Acidobacteriota bacterium]
MKIHFRRTGGFAGLRRAIAIDTDQLAPEPAREFEELVAKACFFDLPARIKPSGPGADRFVYTITVEIHDRQHSVEFTDGSIPPNLTSLLKRLTQRIG